MESQVVYEANGIPSVTIMPSPDKESNGHIPNGHTNGQVPNGHTTQMNGGLSPHQSPQKDPYHGVNCVPRSPITSRRNHLSPSKDPYSDAPVTFVPRSPITSRRNKTPHEHGGLSPHQSPEHHGVHFMSRSPLSHRKQYVPLEANDNDDELGEFRQGGEIPCNDKMVEGGVVDDEEEPPKDRCYIVYLIMALHGVGTLLPWNMFITAEAYFTQHKFANVSDDTEYKDKFVTYLGIMGFVPNVTFLFVCLFFPPKASRFTTIIAVNIMLSLFVLTTILAIVDSSGWPKAFFAITMVTIVLFNCGAAIYQSGLYAMCAKLPQKYMQSYIIGQGLGGSLCAVISIITLAAVGDLKVAAILYFASGVVVLFLCVVTLFTLVKMPFMQYYLDQVVETSLEEKEREALEGERPPLLMIFRDIWLQLYNIWVTFFVTLTVFPSIMVMVEPTAKEMSPFMQKFYIPLSCFLLFNVCDFLGSCVPAWVKWPSAKHTWILTTARILFYPLFLLSNYRPATRHLPVFLNDWAYIIVVIAMALSNGYLKTIVMMDGPTAVRNPNWAGKAASMMVLFLVLGIFCGIQFSLAFPPMSEIGS